MAKAPRKPVARRTTTKKPTSKMPVRRSNSGSNQKDIMPPLGPPKLGKKLPKLTAMEIYKSCWKSRVDSARRCAVRNIKKGTIKKSSVLPPDTPFYRINIYNKDQRHDHKVTVFMPGGLPFTSKSKVIFDCDCSDSAYRFEYAMAKKYGNMFIWRCNGEPPLQTNPGKVAGCCKHVRLALGYIIRKAKDKTLSKVDKSKTNNTNVRLK